MSKAQTHVQTRFPADDMDAAEIEAICKELGERVGEISAIVKLAKVSSDVRESVRQIQRCGIRAHELTDRVKVFVRIHELDEVIQ